MDKKETKNKSCEDKKCPVHGSISTKKEMITGIIYRKDLNHSATILIERRQYLKKYERYIKKTSKIRVHNPPCINAEVGDKIIAARTRPLSKTKNFIITGIER